MHHQSAVDLKAFLVGISAICVLLCACRPVQSGPPTIADAREAIKIAEALRKSFSIQPETERTDEVQVFCDPGQAYSTVVLYNIQDKKTQDDIVAFLKKMRAIDSLKEIRIEFRGARRQLLSLERVLRKESI